MEPSQKITEKERQVCLDTISYHLQTQSTNWSAKGPQEM